MGTVLTIQVIRYKGVDKGGFILAAKIDSLKMQETHFIAYAIFH